MNKTMMAGLSETETESEKLRREREISKLTYFSVGGGVSTLSLLRRLLLLFEAKEGEKSKKNCRVCSIGAVRQSTLARERKEKKENIKKRNT